MKNNSVKYLADNNQPSIVLKNDEFQINTAEIKEKNWNSALTMQAKWVSQILHPKASNN